MFFQSFFFKTTVSAVLVNKNYIHVTGSFHSSSYTGSIGCIFTVVNRTTVNTHGAGLTGLKKRSGNKKIRRRKKYNNNNKKNLHFCFFKKVVSELHFVWDKPITNCLLVDHFQQQEV